MAIALSTLFMVLAFSCFIGTFVAIPVASNRNSDWVDTCSVIALICLTALFGWGAYQMGQTETHERTFEIAALNDGSTVDGRFGIFSGFIETSPVYYVYVPTEQGFERKLLDGPNIQIIEDSETPYYVQECYQYKLSDKCTLDDVTEIHVPPGTVIKDVSLDNEN